MCKQQHFNLSATYHSKNGEHASLVSRWQYLYYITAEKIDISEYKTKNTIYCALRSILLMPDGVKVDTLLSGTRAGKSFSFPSVSPDGGFCCL
jgi:hypothetical protein